MITDLHNNRILVTGATGFLGKHLVNELRSTGCKSVTPYGGLNTQYTRGWEHGSNLTDSGCAQMCIAGGFDYVFHLAGYNGGIAFNEAYPADIFFRNTVMGLNLLEECRKTGVKKVVSIVTSCAYPWMEFKTEGGHGEYRPTNREIMVEQGFDDGPPHPSVACHGYAKRNLQIASSFYSMQYGLKAVCVCPTTLYGPGDSFDPKRTKLMGGIVKRFVDAVDNKAESVTCWGTGSPMREFLYVEDAARLLVQAMLGYEDTAEILNLGTGQELSVGELSVMVARIAGYKGRIQWDTSKSDGQMRKRLDLQKMEKALPTMDFTPLEDGIAKTIEYYRDLKKGQCAA